MTEISKIRFDDGSEGEQCVSIDEDGARTLESVSRLRRADGSNCSHHYARHHKLSEGVMSLADLHGQRWKLVLGTTRTYP